MSQRVSFKMLWFYLYFYHAGSQLITWLAPRAGEMNQIALCDWLPERARWSRLARSGLPAVSRKKKFPESHIINHLLTKFVRPRWLDIGPFCEFMDRDEIQKGPDQYPAILTSHLVKYPYVLPPSRPASPFSSPEPPFLLDK